VRTGLAQKLEEPVGVEGLAKDDQSSPAARLAKILDRVGILVDLRDLATPNASASVVDVATQGGGPALAAIGPRTTNGSNSHIGRLGCFDVLRL
jgi:hypothetical protein